MGKSVNKKLQRMQEKLSRKANVPNENPLKLPWVFEKPLDKIILIGLMILALWKLIELIFF